MYRDFSQRRYVIQQTWLSLAGLVKVLFAALTGLLLIAGAAAASQKQPVAFFASLLGDETSTRLFVDFDLEVNVSVFHMADPARIVVELDEVSFEFAADSALEPRGLVSGISFGRMSENQSRIVLHLNTTAEVIKSTVAQRIDEDSFRFVLDMDAVGEDRFAALASSDRKKAEKPPETDSKTQLPETVKREPGSILVLLDPGHGGIDGGAVGTGGTVEKDLVLKFSKVLKEQIEATGRFSVEMTREDDRFVSLRERVSMSQRLQADLFISVHADSLRQRFVRGSTIYTLSNRASDRLSEELAKSENSVDLIAGLSMPEDTAAVTDILADLTTRETKSFARTFSRYLKKELGREIRLIKNPERYAAFGVLKAPEVPGVLLELGYLSNRDDEKLLVNEDWQEKVAEAVTNAVVKFFDAKSN